MDRGPTGYGIRPRPDGGRGGGGTDREPGDRDIAELLARAQYGAEQDTA